ncbi:MAG: T9SS type A sorting domain-containing protein [Rhodothermales bacterium]
MNTFTIPDARPERSGPHSYAWLFALVFLLIPPTASAQDHSVARQWNEVQIDAIRGDVPRPTIHARNLFHMAAVMYDGWAVYDETARPLLLNNAFGDYVCDFEGITVPADIVGSRNETISYAAYRLLSHRFATSPGASEALESFDSLLETLGYDAMITSADYQTGGPAELGNYIAQCMIDAGLQDGANEANDYATLDYEPVNEPLIVGLPGNASLDSLNRWQPLVREFTTDENGNVIPGTTPGFLSPEWGLVVPFALTQDDLEIFQRDGTDYWVYLDPGAPPYMEMSTAEITSDYLWNFSLVAMWSSHLDPTDGVMWDISPATQGNTPEEDLPRTPEEFRAFYDFNNGGITANKGRDMNPATGQPYEAQMVPRGDYGRVLAEFWADGPQSETPPGHWFTLLNEVNDHPALEKKFAGQGEILEDIEWDVKGYLMLGASVHDVAVSVWGVKSWYDYIRPVSAIRAMADRGQSSDSTLASYSPEGIMLVDGHIELVEAGDALAGDNDENVGKIKLYAWQGPDNIPDAQNTSAGVDWILAENWWPYQQPSFITPPFAGYVSGHSTFSRAAAEILTMLTGDEYFPGGMGEFSFTENEYLIFEDGPSIDITLQWATYRDASDEASLSRIWGGIHPPIDDVPGRLIGIEVANKVFDSAMQYFEGTVTSIEEGPDAESGLNIAIYPNPVSKTRKLSVSLDVYTQNAELQVYNALGQEVLRHRFTGQRRVIDLDVSALSSGVYLLRTQSAGQSTTRTFTVL